MPRLPKFNSVAARLILSRYPDARFQGVEFDEFAHVRINVMELVVQIPQSLPDAMQRSPEEFAREAKMAMAVKLYEMKRLSSGMAAQGQSAGPQIGAQALGVVDQRGVHRQR